MGQILEELQQIGIVPVVVLEDAADAELLADALCEGGLPCAEVTFRTAAAEKCIRIMTEKHPDMLVGAGTVLTTEQVDQAVAAGARFIVSPGLNPVIVKYCVDKHIPIVPGTANPSDVEQAIALGLHAVKFFPAEAAGGLAMIKAMAAPYHNMCFMPTGGINASNLNEYLAFPKILACGGSWMVPAKLVKSKNFAEITRLTREAVLTMLDFQLRHIGVNCDNQQEAAQTAGTCAKLFGLDYREGEKSIFAGTILEAMKAPFYGEKGHIAIGTNSVGRAVHYLRSQGVKFKEESAVYQDGVLKVIYFAEELGGFAIHLVENR